MRKIGEQWEEMIDGKKHLLVIVENTSNLICGGCYFGYYQAGDHLCSFGLDCPASCGVVKDLGVLNDDGCLPSDFGIYPEIIERPINGEDGFFIKAYSSELRVGKYAFGKTLQEAIENWNRRT